MIIYKVIKNILVCDKHSDYQHIAIQQQKTISEKTIYKIELLSNKILLIASLLFPKNIIIRNCNNSNFAFGIISSDKINLKNKIYII